MQSTVEGDNLVLSHAAQISANSQEEAKSWVKLCEPIYLQ
jgi:hypothetical protein